MPDAFIDRARREAATIPVFSFLWKLARGAWVTTQRKRRTQARRRRQGRTRPLAACDCRLCRGVAVRRWQRGVPHVR